MDFIFKFRNECRAAGRAEKVDEKKIGDIFVVFMFLS